MTTREFYSAVIKSAVSEELVEKATELRNALDSKAEKANERKKNKVHSENAPLYEKLLEFLTFDSFHLTSECATAVGVSVSKASALLRQLEDADKVVSKEVKVKGQGTRKGYCKVKVADPDPDPEDEPESSTEADD